MSDVRVMPHFADPISPKTRGIYLFSQRGNADNVKLNRP